MTVDRKIYYAVAYVTNALKNSTNGLNVVLAANTLDSIISIRPEEPAQLIISGSETAIERSIGVYVAGDNIFQSDYDGSDVWVTVDLILRDSDSEGNKQYIYRYADAVRDFLNSISIGIQTMVVSQSITRKTGTTRNRVATLLQVTYDPMTDIDEQGLDLDL